MMEKCTSCNGTYDLVNVNPNGALVVLLCMLCRVEMHWPTAQGGGKRLEAVK